MFLGDVFQVKSGLVVSRKKANDESLAKFNYKQLNLRAINKNGYLEMSELEVLLTESAVSSEYLTTFGPLPGFPVYDIEFICSAFYPNIAGLQVAVAFVVSCTFK